MTAVRDERAGTPGDAAASAGARPRWLLPALIIFGFLVVGGSLGSVGGRLSDMQRNDSTAYLPEGAEATAALAASRRFTATETTTAVVVYVRPAGITEADRVDILLDTFTLADAFDTRLASPPIGPVVSADGKAAQVLFHFVGSDPEQLRTDVDWLRQRSESLPGLEVHVAGPAGAVTDLIEVFGAVDGVLLLVAGAVILLILIIVYRSPILPLLVLAVAGTALGLTNGTAYLLAKANVITISGDAQGIVGVLVLGAATDYALLLASRFREELRRHEDRYGAMRVAWRAAVTPIVASAATVVVALLCLLVSDIPSTRWLGPVAAIGIVSAVVAMLVLLPAVLALCGRTAFWPFRPAVASSRAESGDTAASLPAGPGDGDTAGARPADDRGFWARLARGIGRRPRLVWTFTSLALVGLAFGMVRLEAHGVPRTESFLAPVDSNAGQELLSRHFPESQATPVVIVANAGRLDDVLAAAVAVPGVTRAIAYVDPVEAYDRRRSGQPAPPPKVVDGLARIEATLAAPGDSPAARTVVRELRAAVHAVPAAGAKVGGYTAANLDVQQTAQRDRRVVIPLVLGLIFVILALVLRAVLASLLLTATVILSFVATLGVCGVVFRDVLGFAGADSSFPLFAFVFLVALGVDYNIFLMTRVREEVARRGHRMGTLNGLAVTGGVITSAGVVLAATFAALAVLPLVFLVELAFAVAFGVLLDTLVVRSLLVPALTVDIGRTTWWPGRLRHGDP
jgi:putative drug exporter of the RND superfamily